jgi:hypothetical protein
MERCAIIRTELRRDNTVKGLRSESVGVALLAVAWFVFVQ